MTFGPIKDPLIAELTRQRDALLDALEWVTPERVDCVRCKLARGLCVAHAAIALATTDTDTAELRPRNF